MFLGSQIPRCNSTSVLCSIHSLFFMSVIQIAQMLANSFRFILSTWNHKQAYWSIATILSCFWTKQFEREVYSKNLYQKNSFLFIYLFLQVKHVAIAQASLMTWRVALHMSLPLWDSGCTAVFTLLPKTVRSTKKNSFHWQKTVTLTALL